MNGNTPTVCGISPVFYVCSDLLDQDVVREEDGAGAPRARNTGGERAPAKHGGRPPREDDAAGEAVEREGATGADTPRSSSHRKTDTYIILAQC